jgi:predicted RNA binding protein YcfA (HicA-like mRNA interferase family)
LAYPPNVWNQLKNITAGDLAKALNRDGWHLDTKGGSQHIYWIAAESGGRPARRVSVHIHPQKTYGPRLLKDLLDDIAWTEDELRSLKLIK